MSAVSAMQRWLAIEHEAVWLCALVGARFRELTTQSRRSRDAHLVTRDGLLARLHDAGADPVGTGLSYDVGPVTTLDEAREAVRRVESKIAAACLGLVAEVSGKDRDFATAALRKAALSDLDWVGAPAAFPGLP